MLRLLACIVAGAALAGCASPSAPVTPSTTPTPSAPPAASPSPTAEEALPLPTPSGTPTPPATNASAGDYVAPLFEAQEAVGTAADPASFADTNPFDYHNPWRT